MGRHDEGEAETLVSPSGPGAVDDHDVRSSRREVSGLAEGTLIGRYRLVKRLGAGAMGVVWSAQDPQLDRMIAIKVVHPSLARSPEAASRLMREARAMAKLSNRAVVTIHDAGDVGEHLFIAMEIVEGTNLGTMLRLRDEADLLDWKRWLGMMIDAGHGLIAAHKVGILHRDFKPDNVLVDVDGRVCVGDFGLATLGEDAHSARMSARWEASAADGVDLTTTGALVGTPAYMSPQQLRSQEIDARADQFAYCVAVWEALYGTRPFTTTKTGYEAIPDLAEMIDRGALPPPPPHTRVPDAVRQVLVRGLAADPAQRWPDMQTVVAALESASKRPGTEMKPRRSRAPWIVATGLAMIALVLAVIYIAQRTAPAEVAERKPPVAAPVKPVEGVAKKWFTVAMRTGLAVSTDGKYLAISNDRITVHELATGKQWLLLIPPDEEVSHIEISDELVRFGFRSENGILEWAYRTETKARVVRRLPRARWFGRLTTGDIVYFSEEGRVDLIDTTNAVLRSWQVGSILDDIVVSPDRHRFTYVENGRFTGRIVVCDERQAGCMMSAPQVSPTTATFADDNAVLYALGTNMQTSIYRAGIFPTEIGPGQRLYTVDVGWFGPLRVAGGRIMFVQMQPTPRARVLTRDATRTSSRDLDSSVSLAWTSPTEFLAWNVLTQRVETRTPTTPVALTEMTFPSEPVNATLAGDALIVALRAPSGRQIEAVSRSTGKTIWRHQDGQTLAVRCAGDRAAPCFAIRISEKTNERKDRIVSLVPETGELGTEILAEGGIEDLAVSPKGDKLAYVGMGGKLVVLDLATRKATAHELGLPAMRSISFDPYGGYLLTGTRVRNNFAVARYDRGETTILTTAADDLTMLVRPSSTGNDILVLSRSYQPELWELVFAGGIPGPRGVPVPP